MTIAILQQVNCYMKFKKFLFDRAYFSLIYVDLKQRNTIIEQNDYQGNSLFFFFNQISESPLLKKMWVKMNEFIHEGIDVLSGDHQKHLNMVYEGNYAYFSDLSTFKLETAERCDLAVIRDKFAPIHYTIGLQNNSAYYDIFSEG